MIPLCFPLSYAWPGALEVVWDLQNHRMAWVEKDRNDHLVSTPLLCAGLPTTRPGCLEPHP